MLLQGILLGLSLSFLIGPLLFAVVEAGILQGMRAGVAVAAGIWVSDVLFVGLLLFGIGTLEALTSLPDFRLWAGVIGGAFLLLFGLGSLWKSRQVSELHTPTGAVAQKTGYLSWWFRGFLLNTINPGTVFFWLGITSGVVVPNGWGQREMLVFFGGMLATLVLTDTAKAWAAKGLKRFLTPTHTRKIQRAIGLLMLVFGLALLLRALRG